MTAQSSSGQATEGCRSEIDFGWDQQEVVNIEPPVKQAPLTGQIEMLESNLDVAARTWSI